MTAPVTPRPAATLVLLRDCEPGVEVLMITRHQASGFAGGALVFPGGRVDDREDLELRAFCRGLEGLDDVETAHRVAALRETFEESGILLAARRGDATLLSKAELDELRHRHPPGQLPLAILLEAEGLELAGDLLVPFAHWITPVDRPKRFDTWFYAALMPCDQTPVYDGREAVDAVWVAPSHALSEAVAGRVDLMFVTRVQLMRMARHRTAADILEEARRQPIVTITPEIVSTPQGVVFRIPPNSGYDITELPAAGIRRP